MIPTRVFILLLLITQSCANKPATQEYPDIVIEDGYSYKYDLNNEIYFVTIMGDPQSPTQVKFKLSEDEKKAIKDKFYEIGLNSVANDEYIEDQCYIMPQILTTLTLKKKDKSIKIEIEESCNAYYTFNFLKAKKIKEFTSMVRNIVRAKPEVKNAPKSNAFYL